MQGLPSQLLSKSTKAEAFGDKKAAAKNAAGETVGNDEKSGFASLFANLTGKGQAATKPSDAKSDMGETLKNLLSEIGKKPTEDSEENKKIETVDPKAAEALIALNIPQENIEQKVAKTTSNLDQLLNGLKGIQNSEETSDSENINGTEGMRTKKGEQIKTELKSESPLDFLMKGIKTKNVSETKEVIAPKENEVLVEKKPVMTAEDYLKNMESAEKKGNGKIALLQDLANLPKNNAQNVKGYGQGLSLLSDPLIKNTKDLAFKETKKSNSTSAIEELRTPESKVGAELAGIKQDVIPGLQNTKSNHEQSADTQTQANQKVLDLGKINTTNTTEIIKRISDYVEQNQVANKSSLDLTVKHESLGEFKIQVSKMPSQGSSMVDMQITTSSKEGHDFFVKNEVSLMKNLNQAGINLSDLRIVTTMSESTAFGQSDSKNSSSFSQNPDGSEKQFTSFESRNFSGDSSKGSERRKELWEEYQQRYGA
jgi:hypothetical protein